jgi:hypothetical protein
MEHVHKIFFSSAPFVYGELVNTNVKGNMRWLTISGMITGWFVGLEARQLLRLFAPI